MYLVAVLQEVDARQRLQRDAGEDALVLAAARADDLLQRAAVHILHHQSHAAVLHVADSERGRDADRERGRERGEGGRGRDADREHTLVLSVMCYVFMCALCRGVCWCACGCVT